MTLSLHEASVGTFTLMLRALDAVLAKAESSAAERGIDPAVLLQARLAPDMFPLLRQVQIACDMAKGAACRLAGAEPPKHPDEETTFDGLHARIAAVQSLLAGLDREAIEGAAERPIAISVQGHDLRFTGHDYLVTWALPNFYFHVTTGYAILRHNGVPLGKRDFLGRA